MSTPDSQRDLALVENLFVGAADKVKTSGAAKLGVQSGKTGRPKFRHVSPLSADAIKRMFEHFECAVIQFGGSVFVLRPVAGLFSLPALDVFDLTVGGLVFQVELDRLHELLEVPADWWENTPGSLRAGLLRDAMQDLFSGEVVRVVHSGINIRRDLTSLPCEIAFSVEREAGGEEFRGRLRFANAASAARIVAVWGKLPTRGAKRLPGFSLPARVEILSRRLQVAELQRFRVGALVPVGAPLEGKDVLVSIGWGVRFVAPAVIKNKIVTLQGGVRPMDESQAGNVGVALSDLSKMENLEVQFTVELATCSLPLSELSRLGAGSTLNLGLPHEPALVRLCVNGKPIATGELVVLGQSLGVQIVDMAPA